MLCNKTVSFIMISTLTCVLRRHADVSAGYYVESPEAPEGLVQKHLNKQKHELFKHENNPNIKKQTKEERHV